MQRILALLVVLLMFQSATAAGDILDMDGNVIFRTEGRQIYRDVTTRSGQAAKYEELRLFYVPTGQSYIWDDKGEEIISRGELIGSYHFNKRRWDWVEGAGLKPCSYKGGIVKDCRIKDVHKGHSYSHEDWIYTSSIQGDVPVLTYDEGTYFNEFGEPVYQLKGGMPDWAVMVMVHVFHQQTYSAENMPDIMQRREVYADAVMESNSLAVDMLALGQITYETQTTFMGKPIETVYFTRVNGSAERLMPDQVLRLKNKWIVENEKTWRRSRPHDIPAGGFYTKKKEIKKLGLPYAKGRYIVIEVKAQPAYQAEFRAAIQ